MFCRKLIDGQSECAERRTRLLRPLPPVQGAFVFESRDGDEECHKKKIADGKGEIKRNRGYWSSSRMPTRADPAEAKHPDHVAKRSSRNWDCSRSLFDALKRQEEERELKRLSSEPDPGEIGEKPYCSAVQELKRIAKDLDRIDFDEAPCEEVKMDRAREDTQKIGETLYDLGGCALIDTTLQLYVKPPLVCTFRGFLDQRMQGATDPVHLGPSDRFTTGANPLAACAKFQTET